MTSSGGWADLAGSEEDRALPAADVQPSFPSLTTSAPLNVTTANALRCSDAFACIRVLARAEGLEPIAQLGRLRTRVKYVVGQQLIDKALKVWPGSAGLSRGWR